MSERSRSGERLSAERMYQRIKARESRGLKPWPVSSKRRRTSATLNQKVK